MEIIELKEVVNQLALKIGIDKIYSIEYFEDDITYQNLLILTSPGEGRKFAEIEPFIKMALVDHYTVSFKLYRSDEVRQAILNGNIYFFISCSESNLIYDSTQKKIIPEILSAKITDWKLTVCERFTAWTNKTTSFLVGADFYNNKGDTNLTAFMLHQVLELTYRSLISALLIKEKKTHDLGELQDYVFQYLPQLGKLFKKEVPEEHDILKKLNKAYSSVRYQQNHLVDDKIIPKLFERVETLQTISKWTIDMILELLDKEHEKALMSESKANGNINIGEVQFINITNDHRFFGSSGKFKNALSLVVEYLCPDYIYVFGNNIKHITKCNLFTVEEVNNSILHYDLLVITSKANVHSTNVNNAIEKLNDITANLLIHSKQEVLSKVERGNPFFVRVIADGQLVYQKTEQNELLIALKSSDQKKPSDKYYYSSSRLKRSLALLKAANEIRNEESNTSAMLFALSTEQICLALLYTYMGYVPNIYSLSHLLKMCRIFWPDAYPFFPTTKVGSVNLLNLLSKSITDVRYHVVNPISADKFDLLVSHCNFFIGLAVQHCQTELAKDIKLLNQ
ncbi:hypothetical protein BEL04_08010 [Mucilaginibacter sp. PPCGB 2223]|uniref:HEPN domain-containing protein n=1 Tax=Mucilaginibacter sp. PPCGB 2223 TaxID=1886027 RepID=UPI000825AAEC|nr:HEPN domain-containing protein [Mucilaginibacter sp. PPCGB 2223]OCX54196.1 hypothetical protein BEL04_08010 [Mucilaginibacter sp. PPCGB 2223]